MASELLALCSLISSSVETIDKVYTSHQQTFPSLEDPNALEMLQDAEILQAAQVAIAAAGQLIANLITPSTTIYNASSSMYTTAALGVVEATHVAEILRESGNKGLHVRDIASMAGVDSTKLGRCLRYLASTEHIFTELRPNVFTNNRISSTIDSGKSSQSVKENLGSKYEGAVSAAAWVGLCADEGQKGSAHIVGHILDPATTASGMDEDAPLSRAWGRKVGFFSWLQEPGNELRWARYWPAINSLRDTHQICPITKAFAWKDLDDGSVVVDVGAGIGFNTLEVMKEYPRFKHILQDLPAVISDSRKLFEKESPDSIASGMVDFQAHNFFNPQPITNASVFLLSWIIHDWGTEQAKVIMSQLRNAASPTTRLFIMDYAVPYACKDPKVPSPLYGNHGIANSKIYKFDLTMMNLVNGQERTLGEWVELAKCTGWKLESVYGETGLTFVPATTHN